VTLPCEREAVISEVGAAATVRSHLDASGRHSISESNDIRRITWSKTGFSPSYREK
jgi:hypothetical protein